MNIEDLIQEAGKAIENRNINHDFSADIGFEGDEIVCHGTKYGHPSFAVVVRLTPSMMNDGMTSNQWKKIGEMLWNKYQLIQARKKCPRH